MKRLTSNPWFGKKRLGWGWTPITWQGWVITFIFLLIIVLDVKYFMKIPSIFLIVFIVALMGFVMVALLTSEKPGSDFVHERKNERV